MPVLQQSDEGAEVAQLQKELIERNYLYDVADGTRCRFYLFADANVYTRCSTCTNRTLLMGGWLTDFRSDVAVLG